MLLILVEPFVAVLHQKFVLAKGSVDESIDEGGGEILTGRIDLSTTKVRARIVIQMRLVDVLWRLRFHDVQLARQQKKKNQMFSWSTC